MPKDIGGVGRDRPGRSVRQHDDEHELALPALEAGRIELLAAERVERRRHPHPTRQHAAKLLQSVAIPPGTGKSHLLIGLGIAACEKGHSVRYVTAAQLVNELAEAADERRLSRFVARYGRLELLLVDLCRLGNYADRCSRLVALA